MTLSDRAGRGSAAGSPRDRRRLRGLEETWSRNLLSFMVTPLREIEFVAGVALFGLLKLVMGVGVGVGVGALTALVFYGFDVTSLGLGLVPISAVLLVAGWAVSLFVMGLVLRFGNGAGAFAWGIFFVVMPLSGVLPAERAARVPPAGEVLLPTTHAFAAGRALVDGRGMDWGALGLAALTTVLVSAAPLTFLVWMLRLFRRRGYITRYTEAEPTGPLAGWIRPGGGRWPSGSARGGWRAGAFAGPRRRGSPPSSPTGAAGGPPPCRCSPWRCAAGPPAPWW